jgi:hypothetical protein
VEVLGDLSMTLCDPFAINFLSQSAMKLVNHQVRAARGIRIFLFFDFSTIA